MTVEELTMVVRDQRDTEALVKKLTDQILYLTGKVARLERHLEAERAEKSRREQWMAHKYQQAQAELMNR